jgi:hypothetical protein
MKMQLHLLPSSQLQNQELSVRAEMPITSQRQTRDHLQGVNSMQAQKKILRELDGIVHRFLPEIEVSAFHSGACAV